MNKKPNIEELKDTLSSMAEQIAEAFDVQLDYSIESIRNVETILSELHEVYKSTGSKEGIQGNAVLFGAYIVKVIEKHYGPAKWERDDPTFGPETFPMSWQGGKIFPVGLCLKRIIDGPQDDVWAKFQALIILKDKDVN